MSNWPNGKSRIGLRAAARLLIALCSMAAVSASAEDVVTAVSASAMQRCAALSAPAERLACYDALAGKIGVHVAALPTVVPEKVFGLSAVQRGPVEEVKAITGKVTRSGQSKDGKPTIALDNDQVWELDSSDPLLVVGDAVTIRRAALGSFLLTTPQKRTHHARRLR